MALVDAIELLKQDHRLVEQAFHDYDVLASDEQKRGVVEMIIRDRLQGRPKT